MLFGTLLHFWETRCGEHYYLNIFLWPDWLSSARFLKAATGLEKILCYSIT